MQETSRILAGVSARLTSGIRGVPHYHNPTRKRGTKKSPLAHASGYDRTLCPSPSSILRADFPGDAVQPGPPTLVLGVFQLQGEHGISLWPGWFLHELHFGFVRSSPPLLIARQAGTDDVFPSGRTTPAPWHDMIETQLMDGQVPAAILTLVPITGQHVPPIEVERRAWAGDR